MELSRVSRSELIAIAGGILLGVGVFLAWYKTTGQNGTIGGKHGTFTAWDVHPILRFLFLAGAAAPLILTWIIVRGYALSWPRGEMTAVVAVAALGLLVYNALITRPGTPRSLITVQYGFYVALAGSILMLVGAATRSSETGRTRKPPGTL
ncbi:MAG: hypothetical protein E6G56_03115 [Actinobacteria bacterium]|nr:MAG: hypothetical protein E6G56_03115 [Actinomycetota bacterium]